jgi:4-amino-4-deoxy-L-arabinose transferase-like glycosyltransferase
MTLRTATGSRPLVLLTAAGLVLRVAFLLLEPPVGPIGDERTWTNWAVLGLLSPRVHFSPFRTHMVFYPPLYAYFIAVVYAIFHTLAAVKWVQILVGALLVPAVGRVGERAFGARVGLIAAAIVAFYPELVWFSVHFWSETLFMAFLWWGFERLLAADGLDSRSAAAAAGLLWGLATLTRETTLYFVPLAAVWLAWGRWRSGGLARSALFLGACVLTIAPWTCRNWVVFHAFIPVGTAGSLNLYQGNAPLTREEVYERYYAVEGRIEQHRWARQQGLQAILDRQPWWLLEKLRDEMPNFWEADSQAIRHIKRGAYGPVAPAAAVAAAIVVLLPYLLVLVFFVAGAAAVVPDRARFVLLCFLLYYNLIHVATHGYARYRLPAMPVVFMLAAFAWTAWRLGSYPALSRSRKAMAALIALALVLCLIPSFRENLADPTFHGGRDDAPGEAPLS